jgi:hypothetical protein
VRRFGLGLVVVAFTATLCGAQPPLLLRISVEKQARTERELVQKGRVQTQWNVHTHTPQIQDRSQQVVLNIRIQNLSGIEARGLRVKYAVFGKDMATRAVKLAVRGEHSIDLQPMQTQTLPAEPATFQSRELKYTHGAFAEHNRQSGSKYYGVAVAVYLGEKRVGSYFEPAGLENEIGKLDAGL